MSTLRDVAERAKVSVTTASIVATGKSEERRISPETTRRVMDAMKELNYRPNQTARQLRDSAEPHPVIGVYWPLDYRTNILGIRLTNMNGIILEQNLGFTLMVQTYLNDHIEDFLEPVLKGRCDGVIVGACSERDMSQLTHMNIRLPLVLLNRTSAAFSTVGVNSAQMGMQAAVLLQRKGYTSCAVVQSSDRYVGTSSRTKAFLYACRQLGIDVRHEHMYFGSSTIAGGAQATEEYCTLLNRPPVIFYETDAMAQGGLWMLRRKGLAVPGDVEMLAFGMQAAETMQYLETSISCITIPSSVDRLAITTMAKLLKDPSQELIHLDLEPLVQLRESFRL